MADVYAVAANGYLNTEPKVIANEQDLGGKLKFISDTYEAASLPDGDSIIVGRLPQGTVLSSNLKVTHDALGASTTLELLVRDVNDATDETSLVAAVASDTAGVIEPVAGDIDTLPHTAATDVFVIVKNAGAIATGTLKVLIGYINA